MRIHVYAACNMPNVLHHTVMITVNVVYYFFVFVYKICCFRLHLLFVRNAEGENIRYGNICTQIIVVFFIAHTTDFEVHCISFQYFQM